MVALRRGPACAALLAGAVMDRAAWGRIAGERDAGERDGLDRLVTAEYDKEIEDLVRQMFRGPLIVNSDPRRNLLQPHITYGPLGEEAAP